MNIIVNGGSEFYIFLDEKDLPSDQIKFGEIKKSPGNLKVAGGEIVNFMADIGHDIVVSLIAEFIIYGLGKGYKFIVEKTKGDSKIIYRDKTDKESVILVKDADLTDEIKNKAEMYSQYEDLHLP